MMAASEKGGVALLSSRERLALGMRSSSGVWIPPSDVPLRLSDALAGEVDALLMGGDGIVQSSLLEG